MLSTFPSAICADPAPSRGDSGRPSPPEDRPASDGVGTCLKTSEPSRLLGCARNIVGGEDGEGGGRAVISYGLR